MGLTGNVFESWGKSPNEYSLEENQILGPASLLLYFAVIIFQFVRGYWCLDKVVAKYGGTWNLNTLKAIWRKEIARQGKRQ